MFPYVVLFLAAVPCAVDDDHGRLVFFVFIHVKRL